MNDHDSAIDSAASKPDKPSTFYCIGVGPGDPDLVTYKAVSTVLKADCLALPTAAAGQPSVAYQALRPHLEERRQQEGEEALPELIELVLPMTRDDKLLALHHDAAARHIVERLDEGKSVAMITIGDSTLYSTCFYMQAIVEEAGHHVEWIPGISSVNAAAARAALPLGLKDDSLLVISGVKDPESIAGDLADPAIRTIVIMKAGRFIPRMKDYLGARDDISRAVIVSRLGFDDEKVCELGDVTADERWPYFTTLLIRKKGDEAGEDRSAAAGRREGLA